MGLHADIYSNKLYRYCSNGGISETHDQVTVVNVEGPFEPTDDAPAVLLLPGNLPGTVKAVPAVATTVGAFGTMFVDYVPFRPDGHTNAMDGGAYISTSDSRFSAAVAKLLGHRFYGAVALHDRFETWDEYRAMAD